jgi:diguanylate cyclase (GGDEF)-like protein/PAS domain S-box-containing protein
VTDDPRSAPGAGRLFDTSQLGFLLTHVSEAVLGVDKDGVIEFASPAIRSLTGFSPESVIGQNVLDFLHPDEHDATLERFDRWTGRRGATAGPTVRTRLASGSWTDVSVEALSGPEVEPFAFVLTLRPGGEDADATQALHRRLVNEDRLTRLASVFVNLPGQGIEQGIRSALAEMGGLEGVDRACVVLADVDRGIMRNTHEWCAPDVMSLQADYGVQPWRHDVPMMRALERFETVHLPRIDALPEAWRVERRFWQGRNVRSLLAVPLVDGDRFLGFVGFEAVREEVDWDAHHRATLRSAAGIMSQALARHEAEEQLLHQARHDSLTGLGNRWAFLEAVRASLDGLGGEQVESGAGVAVVLFDLDRFKVINDSLGHTAGDTLLVMLARRLDETRQRGDVLARLGGDEMVMLRDGVRGLDEAVELARAMREAFVPPIVVEGHETYISVSAGVAFTAEPGVSADDLLRDADAAMYLAKARGRDRIEVFDEALRTQMRQRLMWENELRRAVHHAQLSVHYQPELDLDSNRVVGAEALLRWSHPHRGLLPAADFIASAEETGAILEIGAWVLGEACRQLGAWQRDTAIPPFKLRVNLSARQVAQPDLVPIVVHAIEQGGVDPSSVCLEITETTLMADAEVTLEVLEKLRSLGVELAIDDFGTGYSSLSYLKRFPVDVLKIDRSFVDGLGVDPDDTSIVEAIVRLADSLGLSVTAEGVETETQKAELVRLGCRRAQGFLLGRPMPASDFAALVRS